MPRLWLQLSDPRLKAQYETDIEKTIKALTTSAFENLIGITQSFTMDAVSHKLFLIRRVNQRPHSLYTIAPVSPSIQAMIANHFQFLEQLDLINLYKKFQQIRDSRQIAGILFEVIAQKYLQENIKLYIVPMVKLDKVPQGKPQWHSSHINFTDPILETKRLDVLPKSFNLNVKPSKVVYSVSPSPIEEDVCYVPKKTNQVAIDSFIISGGHLYLFQFTIS